MDAILYSKYHGLEKRDSCEFYNLCANLMDWYDLSKDIIMDVGCGPGNTSCKWLLTLFPEISNIIAIDCQKNMIELAETLNPHPYIQYCVANIADKTSLELWEGRINKIVSTFTFQWVVNQENGFQNMFALLKPGGEAALLFELRSNCYKMYDDVVNHQKWKEVIKVEDLRIPEAHSKILDVSYYMKILQKTGFKVYMCKREEKTYVFPTDDDGIGFCKAMFPLKCSVSSHLEQEFDNFLLQRFLKYNGRNSEEKLLCHYSTIQMIIKKPESNITS